MIKTAICSLVFSCLLTTNALATGGSYQWHSNGRCYYSEETSEGIRVEEVMRLLCRDFVGSSYRTAADGKCFEYSPEGWLIAEAHPAWCNPVEDS